MFSGAEPTNRATVEQCSFTSFIAPVDGVSNEADEYYYI